MADINLQEMTACFEKFKQQCKTLQLATINEDGEAEVSYAPFIWHDNELYVFLSELAAHTRNINRQKKAGVMLIADEHETSNLFARERISYQCKTQEIPRTEQEADKILDIMQDVQGKMIGLLRGLNDFHLIKLMPYQGGYVQGFGKAFELTGDGLNQLSHVSTR